MIKIVYLKESTIEEKLILDWHMTTLLRIEVSRSAKLKFKLKLIVLESSSLKTCKSQTTPPRIMITRATQKE